MRKILAVLFLAITLLSLSSCTRLRVLMEQPELTPTRPVITLTPAPTLDNEPSAVLQGVETDQRAVSLIFEGYTDTGSMNDLIQELSGRKTDCVFFVSGLAASEQPNIIRKIANAGFAIGNYGITGRKEMQNAAISDNLHQFTRGQELIRETCGVTPLLFRCNGTQYTREVLQAAAAAGLKAAVQPTVYLNHHSFTQPSDAAAYVQRLVRGSIISVKLGQELDLVEYGYVDDTNAERPAIDPSPGISDFADNMLLSPYQDIVPCVRWLLDALKEEGFTIVSPEKLQALQINLLGQLRTLTDEEAALLEPSAYPLPVTSAPQHVGALRLGSPDGLNGSVFVGNSVIMGLQDYVLWRRKTEPDFLTDVQFLTSPNLTVEAALAKVRPASLHPEYNGIKTNIENALYLLKAKRVYLQLQSSDSRLYSGAYVLNNHKLLLHLIRKQNPGIQICVLSVPPRLASSGGSLTNAQIFRYNLELRRLCMQYGLYYLDTAFMLRNDQGQLDPSYCIDPDTYGIHWNDLGCQRVLQYLTNHVPV